MGLLAGTGAVLCAALATLVAWGEFATARFLDDLGRVQLAGPETNGAAYFATAVLDVILAIALAGTALDVARRPGRTSFGGLGLLVAFAGASGVWALWADTPEAHGPIPMPLAAAALVVVAGAVVTACVVGWFVSPRLPERAPTNPPVPPSHQAG